MNKRFLKTHYLLLLLATISIVVFYISRKKLEPLTPPDYPVESNLETPTSPVPEPLLTPIITPTATLSNLTSFESNTSYMSLIMNPWNIRAECPGLQIASEALRTPYNSDENVTIEGNLTKWHPITVNFAGPFASEEDEEPNPFLDYRLQVAFISPSAQVHMVPGFFDGNGNGLGEGNTWRVRFAPDEVGVWHYCTSFRQGPDIAVTLGVQDGLPIDPNGSYGSFEVDNLIDTAPGFLKWGRLEYVQAHYLKFRDGGFWIKGGTNSPENFLGYHGFDNANDEGGRISNFLHQYSPHIGDWTSNDPVFFNIDNQQNDSKGIIGAINYLSEQHVNSIYLLPMNLGGDGQETYPFVRASGTPFDNTHYDISKLYQWNLVFDHAQRKGIALHVVLNENELENRNWLDEGELGIERKLFYREMIARFSYLLALKWNLCEENVFPIDQIYEFTDYIQALDWAEHPVTFHNPMDWFRDYENLLGDDRYTVTSIQYERSQAGEYVEQWRNRSSDFGRPWVIDMDENGPAGIGLSSSNADELRKEILYDVYFSGGNVEWYAGYHDLPVGGDVRLEDFRTRELMWQYTWYARRFIEENLPFWNMSPADWLLVNESEDHGGGQVFALPGELYAVYLPNASSGGVLNVEGDFIVRWYNPRTGEFEGLPQSISATDSIFLEPPIADVQNDWVVLIQSPNMEESAGWDFDITPAYP